jgi:hypothetical protein
VGDQRERASPVQVESSLQRREQGQKHLPEAGDTSGPVSDKVAPSGEEKLKFSEIAFAGGEPAEVASHSSLIGDDVSISGVGLGLPTVGIAGPIHGQARDVEDSLVSLPQKRQQERCTSTGLVGSPHDVLGHGEDLLDELQEIHTSSFSTLQESISAPQASSTQAQWNSLPASMPAQTLPMTTSSARLPACPQRPRRRLPTQRLLADLYKRSGPPHKGSRGDSARAIEGRATKAILVGPTGVIQDTRTLGRQGKDDKEGGSALAVSV